MYVCKVWLHANFLCINKFASLIRSNKNQSFRCLLTSSLYERLTCVVCVIIPTLRECGIWACVFGSLTTTNSRLIIAQGCQRALTPHGVRKAQL